MTTSPARPLLGTRASRTLSLALAASGVVALVGAVGLVVQAATTGSVTASVELTGQVRRQLDQSLALPDGLGLAGDGLPVGLNTDGLPVGTRVLVAFATALPWVCAGLAALLSARVAWGLHRGEPFRPAHTRLVLGVAALWVVGSYLAPWLVTVASARALEDAGSPAALQAAHGTGSLLVTWLGLVVLLGVAEVFRRGARQAHDVSGLV